MTWLHDIIRFRSAFVYLNASMRPGSQAGAVGSFAVFHMTWRWTLDTESMPERIKLNHTDRIWGTEPDRSISLFK